MTDIERIVFSAIATIVGGVIVYFFGHMSVVLFVEPIHRLRRLIGEIADSLVFYANVYCNPKEFNGEKKDEAKEELRRQCSQLRARVYAVPWYGLWASIRIVRKKADVEEASAIMMELSNSIVVGEEKENGRRQGRIQELLGIKKKEGDMRERYREMFMYARLVVKPVGFVFALAGIIVFVVGVLGTVESSMGERGLIIIVVGSALWLLDTLWSTMDGWAKIGKEIKENRQKRVQ
jgi:hypothetical protein